MSLKKRSTKVCKSTPYFTDFILCLQIIHLTWSPGIKSKQTLADDERSVSVVISLRLSGTPWNQAVYNSGKATIQARLIVLEVARILSQHKWRFATNVNFCGTTDSFFFQVSFGIFWKNLSTFWLEKKWRNAAKILLYEVGIFKKDLSAYQKS